MIQSLEALIQLAPLKRTTVEFNGAVIEVHELNSAQRDELFSRAKEIREGTGTGYMRLNAWTVTQGCDFLTEDDVDALVKASPDLVEALADAINEVSGLNEEGGDDAKKSSESDQS